MICPHCNGTGEVSFLPLGAAIRNRRKALGLSQKEVAHATGISPQMVSALETGENDTHTATLFRIAAALRCSPGSLLSSTAPPLSPSEASAGNPAPDEP